MSLLTKQSLKTKISVPLCVLYEVYQYGRQSGHRLDRLKFILDKILRWYLPIVFIYNANVLSFGTTRTGFDL